MLFKRKTGVPQSLTKHLPICCPSLFIMLVDEHILTTHFSLFMQFFLNISLIGDFISQIMKQFYLPTSC